MTSSVSICSNALIRLGDKPISSFEDGTSAALRCAILYPSIRNAMLRAHPWDCARKRVVLNPLSDTPSFDYAHAFQMPADWLRTLQVGSRQCPIDYVIEGRQILSNATSIPLVYIWRNTTEASWDDTFVEVVTAKMTSVLAYPITQSASMEQVKETEFQQLFKQAKAVNGQENQPETLGDFPLLEHRLAYFSRVPGR